MPSLAEVVKAVEERLAQQRVRSIGAFEVVTTAPFTVYLDGDETTAVPAYKLDGASYSVGTKGRYILDQGQQPICFPTA